MGKSSLISWLIVALLGATGFGLLVFQQEKLKLLTEMHLGDVQTKGSPFGPVHVIDGDTLDSQGARWRIAAIDTPERGEAFYKAAKDRLTELTARGVRCQDTGEKPSHGRLIGICMASGQDVALILVSEGLAAACHNRPLSRPYLDPERTARSAKRGIWADSGYRRKGYCNDG